MTDQPKKAPAKKAAAKKASAKKAAPTPEERVVQWAVTQGAPVRLIEGWDPDTGHWADGTPIAEILRKVGRGVAVTVAGRQHGFKDIQELLFRAAEMVTSEDRLQIPIEVRPLTDLLEALDWSESDSEAEMTMSAYDKAMKDANPKHALDFLARRWPNRWREQQQITTGDDDAVRNKVISELVSDPATAMKLAELAESIEDGVEKKERDAENVA
jgi:hypothetical protein